MNEKTVEFMTVLYNEGYGFTVTHETIAIPSEPVCDLAGTIASVHALTGLLPTNIILGREEKSGTIEYLFLKEGDGND